MTRRTDSVGLVLLVLAVAAWVGFGAWWLFRAVVL